MKPRHKRLAIAAGNGESLVARFHRSAIFVRRGAGVTVALDRDQGIANHAQGHYAV
jgi:hypothetical protein